MIAQDVLNPATSPSAGPKHSVPIRKAAVLGAGVMGSRIAAHRRGCRAQWNCHASAGRPEEEQTRGFLRPGAGRTHRHRELRG